MKEISTENKNEGAVVQVVSRVSPDQSLRGLAKAFFFTAIGDGEAAARQIDIYSQGLSKEGNPVIGVSGTHEVKVHL